MYTPSHTHRDNPPWLFVNDRPRSPAVGLQVAPCLPRLNPTAPLLQGGV